MSSLCCSHDCGCLKSEWNADYVLSPEAVLHLDDGTDGDDQINHQTLRAAVLPVL